MEDLLRFETEALDAGYEGVIFRSPDGLHKNGRATVKGGTYMRIKRFIDFEGTIVGFTEAMENTNEAKTNELGRTERSTHQANMVPKGMIGNITLKALKDVKDPFTKQVLIAKDQEVLCGAGSMTHEDRIRFWNAPSLLVGQVGKAKFFPKGQKDKPRFPIYQGVRATEDMSE
jgi:DNA ligase-1